MNTRNEHTLQMKGQRGLGLGFGEGNAFHLFSHEPNRGLINPIPFTEGFLEGIITTIQNSKASSILSVIAQASQTKLTASNEQLDEIVKDILALTIPDILVDINITKLQKMMPSLIHSFSPEVKHLFAQYGLNPLNSANGKRFLHSIVASKYELFSDEQVELEIEKKIEEIQTNLILEKFDVIDNEIMAYLLPALLDHMNNHDLRVASYAIASQLEAKYFLAVADKQYFIPEITASHHEKIAVKNTNKRSLQFFASSPNSWVHFRGTDYTLQHTHIHFEKDGEENEYDLDGKKFDGEIHTIFEFNHKGNKKRLMAIGFPLSLTQEDNPKINELLTSINQLEEVKQWKMVGKKHDLVLDMKQLDFSTSFKNLFMTYFDQAKNNHSLLFHSWASLRSNTYGFRAGLRFVIAPIPITLSENQYRELKEIFGEMNKNLKEEDKLDPIDRKAGLRKQRHNLSKSLEEKILVWIGRDSWIASP